MEGMKLNEKHKLFCREYLKDHNATQAAIRAGYSAKTAEAQSSRLLRNVNIKTFINAVQEKDANKLDISRERVLKELAAIAFSDIRKYYDENGELVNVKELEEDAAAGLAGVEVDELFETGRNGAKKQIGVTKKIKRWDKVKAIEAINKMLGYNAPEKHDVRVDQYDKLTVEELNMLESMLAKKK